MLHSHSKTPIILAFLISSIGIGIFTHAAFGNFLFGLGTSSPAPTAPLSREQQSTVTLQVALVAGPSRFHTPAGVDATIPQHDVRFMIINHSQQKWEIQFPDLAPAQVIVVKPNGEEVKLDNWLDMPDPAHLGVSPGQMVSWTESINNFFASDLRFKEVGLYRLYWQYRTGPKGDDVIRSNDLLIWIDQTVPLFDPDTLKIVPRQ
ncbi:MAG: hypothetical protein JO316_25525 [Abitibacteriaceae bacterium]|nr:hypothetical protein [Abditibacteriaceae bacterium]